MFTWITFSRRQTFTVICMNNKFIVVDWCEEIGKECLSLLMQKKELCAAAWKNKKVVFYLSTNCNPSETINVQRKQRWNHQGCS